MTQPPLSQIVHPRRRDGRGLDARDGRAAPALDRHIRSGIAVSFFVAVVTIPFGYLTTLTLGRVSPDALGVFSTLGIYLSIVYSIFYFGGGTVTLTFSAQIPRTKARAFFLSYFAINLSIFAGYFVVLQFVPQLVPLVFHAEQAVALFGVLLLWTPVALFFYSAVATLRGFLLLTLAQSLVRAVTLATCLVYAYVFLFHRAFFARHYVSVIVIPYFCMLVIAGVVAYAGIHKYLHPFPSPLRWYLPPGFWRFAASVQTSSLLAFAQTRLDQLLLLRALGLSRLGVYFAVSQIADAAPLVVGFLVDAVFPAVVNLRNSARLDSIQNLYDTTARQVLLVSSMINFALLAFSQPILGLFGEQYSSAHFAFVLLVIFCSLDALGSLNHTLIVGMSRMNHWTGVQVSRLIVFVLLFDTLVSQAGITGAVIARGVAWLAAGAVAYLVVLSILPFKIRLPHQYLSHVLIACALGTGVVVFGGATASVLTGSVLFAAAMIGFLLVGRYRWSELQEFWAALVAARHRRETPVEPATAAPGTGS